MTINDDGAHSKSYELNLENYYSEIDRVLFDETPLSPDKINSVYETN